MAEYKAIYKCRLCGEEIVDCITSEYIADRCVENLIHKDTYYSYDDHTYVQRFAMHNCDDGSFGFADFQGMRKINEENYNG